MSENWVGPGWWMASDGKWYPPRVTSDAKEAATGATSTRWSRRTPGGDPIPGSKPMSLSEQQAELLATRAERAASVAKRRVSIRREDVDEFDMPDVIDLDEHAEQDQVIDLRSSAQPTPDSDSSSEPVPTFVSSDGIDAALDSAGLDRPGGAEASVPPTTFSEPPAGPIGFLEADMPPIPDMSVPEVPMADLPMPTVPIPPLPLSEVPKPVPPPDLPDLWETDADVVHAEVAEAESDVAETQSLTSIDDRVDDVGIENADINPHADVDANSSPIVEAKLDAPIGMRDEVRVAPRLTVAKSGGPSTTRDGDSPAPLVHAVLPALVEREPERSRSGPILLVLATALAIASGVLGALWLRERSDVAELRAQLVQAEAPSGEVTPDVNVEELNDQVRTITLENERLQQQLNDMSALVLELPAGRVTEIEVPFTPIFADEENGRLIAMGADGEYIVWGEGVDGPITDSGSVDGTPTGLFAATRKAWVSTDSGRIDVLSLVANEPGLPSVEFGPTAFLAAEERGYWTFNSATGEVVRLRKSDGGITAGVAIPVPVIDLTIGAGSVWALGDDGRVYRINTADFTVQPFDVGADLISVTAGPDALWTLSAADGSLRRVDPVSGEVLVTVPVGRDPIDATFAGSSVWVALRSGASLIEVDTRTSAVVSRTTLPSEPTALHQGDSGVFVTTEGDVPLLQVASLTVPDSADSADSEESTTDDADS